MTVPKLMPLAIGLFAVGVLAIIAVFALFATGHSDLPALAAGRPAVLLQKPYDAREIAAALAAAGV